MNVEALITRLELKPHPEGGYYRETYRSPETIPKSALANRYSGDRLVSTSIYYLLTADSFSCMHILQSDELWHFYLGDPVEQLLLFADGTGKRRTIGADVNAGQEPQALVPHGVWQGSRVAAGGRFALVGCTVSPGFDFADYKEGTRAQLTEHWGEFAEDIARLTRK